MALRASRAAPLAVLLAAGLGLRAIAMAVYSPAVLDNPDSARYLFWAAPGHGVVGGSFAPAGYAAFLRLAQLLSDRLELVVALQHLLGLGTAVLLYLAVRRGGAPRGPALVPAAAVLLSGDQIYVEHALLSEPLFAAAVAAGLYAAMRSLDGARPWLIAAGLALGVAGLVRSAGLIVLAAVGLWALAVARPGSPGARSSLRAERSPARRVAELAMGAARARLPAAALVLVAGLLPVGLYAGLAGAMDRPTGLTDIGGWHLYARIAPFADCERFDPPAGAAVLCERSPAARRPGPAHYLTAPGSPARRAFGVPPSGDDRLGAFARAAILRQPLDYAAAVAEDLARFAEPTLGSPPPGSRGGYESISFDVRNGGAEEQVERRAARAYEGTATRVDGGLSFLASYQRLSRPGGWLLLGLAVLAVLGATRGRGRLRAGTVLLGLAALTLYVVPAATAGYAARFGVPALGPLAGAGALGAWALRVAARGEGPTPPCMPAGRSAH